MAQGCLYSKDGLERLSGAPIPTDDEERVVKQLEKHIDFFVLLSL